ncbi:hypothetical protein [Photobacterium damselae]|uniref:hypothetical protein n=1 Tax=Photobacterium damselae TaxID=38293 RepID=UPI001F22C39D|nr:hypothetical protein [Photobacterium damselae]UKA04611.1 hypothetical protein IHC89_23620 [Photobacterium damselae subsp. damselae]
MFVEKKTKLQIEQGVVENLLKDFKHEVIGDTAKCLRSVLGSKSIMRMPTSSEVIEKLTGAQYSVFSSEGLIWVDGVAFSETDFVAIAMTREMVAQSAYIYAGGDISNINEVKFEVGKPISIFEESFIEHMSEILPNLFNYRVLGGQKFGDDVQFPSQLTKVELAFDAISDIYIDEMAFDLNGAKLVFKIIVTKSLLTQLAKTDSCNGKTLDNTVKRNVEVSVSGFYECESMLLEDIVNLEVGDCIPIQENLVGGLKSCLKSGDVILSHSGTIGTNSSKQIIFKCN